MYCVSFVLCGHAGSVLYYPITWLCHSNVLRHNKVRQEKGVATGSNSRCTLSGTEYDSTALYLQTDSTTQYYVVQLSVVYDMQHLSSFIRVWDRRVTQGHSPMHLVLSSTTTGYLYWRSLQHYTYIRTTVLYCCTVCRIYAIALYLRYTVAPSYNVLIRTSHNSTTDSITLSRCITVVRTTNGPCKALQRRLTVLCVCISDMTALSSLFLAYFVLYRVSVLSFAPCVPP